MGTDSDIEQISAGRTRVTLGELLLEAFPSLQRLLEGFVGLSLVVSQWAVDNRETIAAFIELSKAMPALQPHVQNILLDLKNPEYEIADDIVELIHIFSSIDLSNDPSASTLLTVLSGASFQASMSGLFKESELHKGRLPLIQEALVLHNKGHYAGSICLLYGQLEGTLSELFVELGYIEVIGRKVCPRNADGTIDKRKNLTGLVPKLKHAITRRDRLETFYGKVIDHQLVHGDPDQTIPRSRNSVLHGGDVMFNNEKRSAQLMLWAYSAALYGHHAILSQNLASQQF